MAVSEIVSVACSCVFGVVTILVNSLVLCKKNKKAKILNIFANVPSYVSQAEQIFGPGNGKAKLQWVITKIQIDCVKANVEISEDAAAKEVERVLETPQKKEVEYTSESV